MFEKGEVVDVVKQCQGTGTDGYLVADVGDRVEVLHFEEGDDEDWVFARNARNEGHKGWLSVNALRPPADSGEVWLYAGATVSVTEDVRPVGDVGGYLAASAGDSVEILYVGSTRTNDEGWLFVARPSGTLEDVQGWLNASKVQALLSAASLVGQHGAESALPHHVQSEPGQPTRACSSANAMP